MTDKSPPKPTVFISYSHKDEVWKDRFIPQLRALEQAGRIVVWDDRKIDGGEKWYPEIKTAMEEAAVAVCLVSPDYLASGFCVKEEVPFLLQRCEREGMVLIPMLLRPCPWKAFEWLKEIQMLPRDGKSVVVDFNSVEDSVFADVANLILEIVDDPSKYKLPAPPAPLWSSPEKISIERLPNTGAELFGRKRELELLDATWAADITNIVTLVAWGGVGKSTLVNKWLERMQADNYRGGRRVFAWSFYSQGTGERVTSADQFINAALQWFGDADPTAGSPWDKGERLARLVQAETTLLLLDGLEPLQSPHAHERGKIKDPALATLLLELAESNPGLCVITTREAVSDLAESAATVLHKDLEQISDEAGRALLRVGGVQGTDAELEQATRDFGNHALAINLLAVYLRDVPGHHISYAAEIPDLDIPEAAGKHPRRLLAAFAARFGDGPEVELLRVLGLFDHPANSPSLTALRAAPPISSLTNHLVNLSEADWLRLVERLRQKKLIAPASHHGVTDLDAHPLVREHFGEELKTQYADAWREGNNRLYEHLRDITKELPETLEEMAPLYAAIAHGCAAGRHQEALHDVYQRRMQRGAQAFSTKNLGAIGAEVAVLSGFFDPPWQRPVSSLGTASKGYVLNEAGFILKALGQLREAILPMETGLGGFVSQQHWKNATITSAHLSLIYLSLGDLQNALTFAQQSVGFADKSDEIFDRLTRRALLGYAFHLADRSEAESMFNEAETLQKESDEGFPILSAMQGFLYCDFLLAQGRYEEVRERVTQTLPVVQAKGWLLDIALDYLSLGRACLLQAQDGDTGSFPEAMDFLNRALSGLRQASYLDHLPRGLLARAELCRAKGEFRRAQADLDEGLRIATRGEMGLHKADCHLQYARLYLAMGETEENAEIKQQNREKAREHWTTAKEMIERMGYHRRDKDVKEIEELLSV